MPRREVNLDLEPLHQLTQMVKTAGATRLKFAEYKDNFEKVAFDLFKDTSGIIWKLEKDADSGEEFIVRTAEKVRSSWSAEINMAKDAINLLYKGTALGVFKKADLEFTDENVEEWRDFLLQKVQAEPEFLTEIIAQIGPNRRKVIASTHPELFEKK